MIPEYIDIGVDVLNPIQPECNDQAEIARLYGDRLTFWGRVGAQQVMPFGTPDDVRAHVQEVWQTLGLSGRGGAGGGCSGLLLAPTHILEQEVPWANVLAFVDAVRSLKA